MDIGLSYSNNANNPHAGQVGWESQFGFVVIPQGRCSPPLVVSLSRLVRHPRGEFKPAPHVNLIISGYLIY